MAEMDEILQTFLSFDRDGSGFIDREEFSELVVAAGASLDPGRIDEAFNAVDIDGNGVIDFNEFIRWWYERMERRDAARVQQQAQKMSTPVARIEPVKRAVEAPGAKLEAKLEAELAELRKMVTVSTQCEAAAIAETSAVRAELRKARETVESQRGAIAELEKELGTLRAKSTSDSGQNVAALKEALTRVARENRELRKEFEKVTDRLAKLRDNAVEALFRCGTD
jgi:calmodulin